MLVEKICMDFGAREILHLTELRSLEKDWNCRLFFKLAMEFTGYAIHNTLHNLIGRMGEYEVWAEPQISISSRLV